MRLSSLVTLLLAVVLAGAAGLLAQSWLEQQRRMGGQSAKGAGRATVVVATRPLRFGTQLSEANIRELDWPSGTLPAGAFAKVADLLKATERRIALMPIEPNELILASKITGPGQRATLSSLIGEGMKAITIRVNDVNGVAGFVLPGDRIDVMITRKPENGNNQQLATEVLLQDVKVLGIDQLADERSDKAMVVKTVTVEVSIADAQRVVLASSVGSLSLALRAAGSSSRDATGRITSADLNAVAQPAAAAPAFQPAAASAAPPAASLHAFGVTRAIKRTEYSVPEDRSTEQTAANRDIVTGSTKAPAAAPRSTPSPRPAARSPAAESDHEPEPTVSIWQEALPARPVPYGNTGRQIAR